MCFAVNLDEDYADLYVNQGGKDRFYADCLSQLVAQ